MLKIGTIFKIVHLDVWNVLSILIVKKEIVSNVIQLKDLFKYQVYKFASKEILSKVKKLVDNLQYNALIKG